MARCVAAMQARVRVPVTVKCRIGIDDQDSEADLERFIAAVAGAGCRTFIVHARKAWLQGLSPKENREVPPLDYGRVYRLKAAHPELEIVINGGIDSLAEAEAHLAHVDGVALGRAAYQNPYLLAEVDRPPVRRMRRRRPTRRAVLEQLVAYAERHLPQRRPAQQYRAAHPRPLPRPAAGARLPPPSVRAGAAGRRGHRACSWRRSASPKASDAAALAAAE